jgi:glycosyltransferase involved in cell wall biosynthesis
MSGPQSASRLAACRRERIRIVTSQKARACEEPERLFPPWRLKARLVEYLHLSISSCSSAAGTQSKSVPLAGGTSSTRQGSRRIPHTPRGAASAAASVVRSSTPATSLSGQVSVACNGTGAPFGGAASVSVTRLSIVAVDEPLGVGGIRDYSYRLLEVLEGFDDIRPALVIRRTDGRWFQVTSREEVDVRSLIHALRMNDGVIVQYNPFMYGRWGFAPWLPAVLARTRRGGVPPRIGLMIHEPYVPFTNVRSVVMGLWQRSQLAALRANADVVLASIEAWANRFRLGRSGQKAVHLPVGSNLPDMSAFRDVERARTGIAEDTVVMTTLGGRHPSLLRTYVIEALNATCAQGFPVVYLNLGAGAPIPCGLSPRIDVRTPGLVSAEELASMLATADIFLAPSVDGVSTRRTSLMAALQHGVAVVGTEGPLTDGILRRARTALALTPVGQMSLFADAVAQLAESEKDRRAIGMSGKALYEREFDWPVLSNRLIEAMRTQ